MDAALKHSVVFSGVISGQGRGIYLLTANAKSFYRCLKLQEPPGIPDKFSFTAAIQAAVLQTKQQARFCEGENKSQVYLVDDKECKSVFQLLKWSIHGLASLLLAVF